jgi:hypothetical protein
MKKVKRLYVNGVKPAYGATAEREKKKRAEFFHATHKRREWSSAKLGK